MKFYYLCDGPSKNRHAGLVQMKDPKALKEYNGKSMQWEYQEF